MAVPYNHHEVETKWQAVWDDEKAFRTSDDYSKPKYYALVEFPYPSGQGLHVGHPRPYTAQKEKNAGLQCTVSHGMGRFRPPYRELCNQKSYPSQDGDEEQCGAFQEPAAFPRILL